jgi:hypothetical protein
MEADERYEFWCGLRDCAFELIGSKSARPYTRRWHLAIEVWSKLYALCAELDGSAAEWRDYMMGKHPEWGDDEPPTVQMQILLDRFDSERGRTS